jgi:hypothetical protein
VSTSWPNTDRVNWGDPKRSISIEDLIVFDVIQLAADESKEPLTLFGDIIEICSRRLAEAGTGLSLRVETR